MFTTILSLFIASASATEHVSYALTDVAVGGFRDGFDLDGDGTTDNALWITSSILNPLLDTALASAPTVSLVQVGLVDDWSDDSDVTVGFLVGRDSDGDGVYSVGRQLNSGGLAKTSCPATLSGGVYTVAMLEGSITIGGITLESATPIYVEGELGDESTTGVIGMALPLDSLLTLADRLGLESDALEVLESLMDIDSDGDGSMDAVSAAFVYSGPISTVVAGF